MNRNQTKVLYAVAIIGVLIGAFPPWVQTTDFTYEGVTDRSERPAGYSFILAAPEPSPNWLGRGTLAQRGVGVRVDGVRIGVQYLVLTVAAGGLLLLQKRQSPTATGVVDSPTAPPPCPSPAQPTVDLVDLLDVAKPNVAELVTVAGPTIGGMLAQHNRRQKNGKGGANSFEPFNDLWGWFSVCGGAILVTFFSPGASASVSLPAVAGRFVAGLLVATLGGGILGILVWKCSRRSHSAGMIGFAIGAVALIALAFVGQTRMGIGR